MIEKLSLLCAKTVARDSSKAGRFKLRSVLRTVIPTSLSTAMLSLLPLNILIELEEDHPWDSSLLKAWWKDLCEKCAENHVPFRKRLQQLVEEDQWEQNYKELLLNAYFKEVLDSCSVSRAVGVPSKVPRMSSQYILQDSLGPGKHNLSDEEMLKLLSKHITELTLRSKYIQCIRILLGAGDNCFAQVKSLKLDTCHNFYQAVDQSDWISCVNLILGSSQVHTISTTTCCKILGDVLGFLMKRKIEEPSLWDEAVLPKSHLLHQGHDDHDSNSGIYENMIDGESHTTEQTIKELVLRPCSNHDNVYCNGLESMSSLERLTFACKSEKHLTQFFFNVSTRLLKSGLSHLKYIHIVAGQFQSLKQLADLGRCLNDANNFVKEVVFEKCCMVEHSECDLHQPPYLLNSSSTIRHLAVSGAGNFCRIRSEPKPLSLVPLFNCYLTAYNPKLLWISFCDTMLGRHEQSFLTESTSTSQETKKGIVLSEITMIYETHAQDSWCGKQMPLVEIVADLVACLKSSVSDVDLRIYCNDDLDSEFEVCSSFKSFELVKSRQLDSVNSREDFVAEM